MINSEIFALIAIGLSSIFGLQGALKLSINHYTLEVSKSSTSCNKILLSKEAFFIKIPISYLAVIYYVVLLLQLIILSIEEDFNLYWINIEILFAVVITFYYALIMFFKLQIICFSCLRIYLANIIMGASIIAYHFY